MSGSDTEDAEDASDEELIKMGAHDLFIVNTLRCFMEQPKVFSSSPCTRHPKCTRTEKKHICTLYCVRSGSSEIQKRSVEELKRHPGQCLIMDTEARAAYQKEKFDKSDVKQCQKDSRCTRLNRHPGLCRIKSEGECAKE